MEKIMNPEYIFRRAESLDDGKRLNRFFYDVFHPEKVGELAETMFYHLPNMKMTNWFIAEDKSQNRIASAFALIPWKWEIEGVPLKVAEMGLVGTREEYRGKGLINNLNREFDDCLENEGYDLAAIQGIPGFYHKFGYHYALEMENHINVTRDMISGQGADCFTFRLAIKDDIPLLMEEDNTSKNIYSVSAVRSEADWDYLFTESRKTEYGSEFWLMEHSGNHETYYFRIRRDGFGKGLIINEVSSGITELASEILLDFCLKLADKRNKPWVRLDLHRESALSFYARTQGAHDCKPYAWQIRIPHKIRMIKKLIPVLEKRIELSGFAHYSGTLKFDFYQSSLDIIWEEGRVVSVEKGSGEEKLNTFCIGSDMFPALCLGYRTWKELQYIRPDSFPQNLIIDPDLDSLSGITGKLVDILFPKKRSWIYGRY